MNISLYEISKEFKELMEKIEDSNGELVEIDEGALKQLSIMLEKKTDSCVGWVQSQEDMVEVIEKRIEDLSGLKQSLEKKINRFGEYVFTCMEILQKDKLLGEMASITKRKPSKIVDIFNEDEIPIEFIKVPEPKPMIMKAEIAKALKNGLEVTGARLKDSDKKSVQFKIKSAKDV